MFPFSCLQLNMANTEGYTFTNTDTVTGDRANTTVRNAIIDLANNTTGYLSGTKILAGSIPASEFVPDWVVASSPQTAVNGGFYLIAAGDTITLPASPSLGDSITIKQNSGDMTSSNATIDGGTKNISDNGFTTEATTYAIDKNFITEIRIVYNGTKWKV